MYQIIFLNKLEVSAVGNHGIHPAILLIIIVKKKFIDGRFLESQPKNLCDMSLKLVFVNSYLSISHFKGNIFPSVFVETAGIHRAEILSVHKSKSLSEGGAMAGDLRLLVTQRSYCALAAGFEKVMTSYPCSGLEQVVTPHARICAESREPSVVFFAAILSLAF